MTFNLIATPWLPVRRLSGRRETVTPAGIVGDFEDNPVVDLDFGRPDFEGAVSEFLIGLLSVAWPPQNDEEWAARWQTPPAPAKLEAVLQPLVCAFDLDGPGPRCFQDADPLEKEKEKPLRQLLIEAPGANTLSNNADLFQKRGEVDFTQAETAAALIALQSYAPSGGAGHRTSLRGGGPLTTLVQLARRRDGEAVTTLWDRLWPNVLCRDHGPPKPLGERTFPWLGPTRTSSRGQVTTPEHGPNLVFFACPRRIRLVFDAEGRPSGYRTFRHGANYDAAVWRHPLSPYYQTKDKGLSPRHPQSGPATYRDWLGIAYGSDERAEVVKQARKRFRQARKRGGEGTFSVLAFGYDMDNMKARGWVQQEVPVYPLSGDQKPEDYHANIATAVEAAKAAAESLRDLAQIARFGEEGADGSVTLPKDLKPETCHSLALVLWADSEGAFRLLLQEAAEDGSRWDAIREDFFKELRIQAFRIYNAEIDDEALADRYPVRLARARHGLALAFSPNKTRYSFKLRGKSLPNRVWKALGFEPLQPKGKKEKAA